MTIREFRLRPFQLLALLVPLSLGMTCAGLQGVLIIGPAEGQLITDDTLMIDARVGRNLDPASVEFEVDGVDLIDALALTHPFVDEGGVVMIGGDPVTITGFSFVTLAEGPRVLEADLDGLAFGPHGIRLFAPDPSVGGRLDLANFEIISDLTLEAQVLAASGLPAGPQESATEGTLVNATFGEPLAAPPLPTADGGSLRSGFVETAEARIAGSP